MYLRLKDRLVESYNKIKPKCCLISTSDKKYFHKLICLIASIKDKFPDHPKIYIYDLGLTKFQIMELEGIKNLVVKKIPSFVNFFNLCFTWKPYTFLDTKEEITLHIDAGALALRDFKNIFLSINKNGYFVAGQDQLYKDITPEDYLNFADIDINTFLNSNNFAGGFIGYKKNTPIHSAIIKSLEYAKNGYFLGYSKSEMHRAKFDKEKIVRNCKVFRHDQTLFGLFFFECLNNKVNIRQQLKYIGHVSNTERPNQVFWMYRNRLDGLYKYILKNNSSSLIAYLLNRIKFLIKFINIKFKSMYYEK